MNISKILLIDDDVYIRRVGELTLSRVGGWQVVAAASGAEALELVARERPDVILLDVMMPAMDGPQTLSKLRELEGSAAVPVIFMTAKVQQHEVQAYLLLDSAGVITKPFDPMTLPHEIIQIVASWSKGKCKIA